MTNREIVSARIRQRLEETGRSAASVSRAAGHGVDFIRDFLTGRKKRMSADALVAIARELGVTVAWLQGNDEAVMPDGEGEERPARPRTVPVYGTAAGRDDGAMHLGTDVIDWLSCPPGLEGARDAYALYVVGESMQPRYYPGDVVIIAPHRPPRAGDCVVIQCKSADTGATEAWVKEYVATTADEIVARQYNPPAEMRFPRAEVSAVHRIMTLNDLLS
ncbi:XRE family transcriptional regulator [Oricola thermophila]|uniref:LexA family transcriptional regulator n=1 Tax=Oricola thermophila TaxID=2742145 RepID=A0A6N1VKH9_9HYPH|nr:S24 family peptidase [Oricola thermophila]QKV20265.1 LexA family transcriptional regulator [Oricola thermophila]